MTDSDKRAFAQAYARVTVAHHERATDAAELRVIFDALGDVEIEFVVAAAERLMCAEYFPKVAAWRREAHRVERERIEALRELLRKLPEPLCTACSDTGWVRDADDRVCRCDCQHRRRLEVLGRLPWPALPAAAEPADTEASQRVTAMATSLAQRKGVRPLSPVERAAIDDESSR